MLAVLLCYPSRLEASLDDALPGDLPWSFTAGNRDAGLGESPDEIRTLVRESSNRAKVLAQQATARAEGARRIAVHGEKSPKASAQAAMATRAAVKAREAAARADQAARTAWTISDLDLMRELERMALRAETQADAAARTSEAAR
ncbi:hypothetical protein J7E99_31115 [Streptomyces sp. ISL-44]|uniref:hypothetical protein n=1 Tax=Streptomyces sp. ISL-44 TaxID=2819184 RepID=UPI001BE64DBD|nr:hypothetical protein [Streptomyces sp. ISL-44]MBT2545032.1 hypothetical protein [Streptomyces sp. ISL-44]